MTVGRRLLATVLFFLGQCQVAHADALRVGLVLGGGGARGAAHIGVLQVLAEQRIAVACVAGTSMGALVAGAYAQGVSPDEMAKAMARANWRDMFIDSPKVTEFSPRSRSIARAYLPSFEFGVTDKGPVALPSVINGQKIKLFFNELIHAEKGDPHIEALKIPLSLVATDLVSGEKVSFRQGSLSYAMRASMSVPGVMSPVNYAGTRLVDGGLVDNVPIDEVMSLCQPDVVIAVNVGSPLFKANEIDSLLSVAGQMVNILTEQNVTRSLTLLKPTDVYIKPELDGITSGDFEKHVDAIARGRRAAEQMLPALSKLSSSADRYEAWWASVQSTTTDGKVVDAIDVAELKRVQSNSVSARFERYVGHPIEPAQLNEDLMKTYGQGDFDAVDYSLTTIREKNVLRIAPSEKAFGPDFLRAGFNLDSVLGKRATYNLRVAYNKTWINPLGGEVLVGGQLGNNPKAFAEWYQPLEDTRTWFLQTGVYTQRDPLEAYQNNRAQASFTVDESRYELMAGANLATIGSVQLGRVEKSSHIDLETGNYPIVSQSKRFGGWAAKLDLDQFDRLFVPTHGWSAKGNYFVAQDQSYAKSDIDLRVAENWRPYVVHGRLYSAKPIKGDVPVYDSYALGGFLNLSGYARNQVVGQSVDYSSMRVERVLGSLPIGLRGDMRAGVALEYGKVGQRYTETEGSGLMRSVAVYLGGETPLGPLYIGVGKSPGGTLNTYLFLGTP